MIMMGLHFTGTVPFRTGVPHRPGARRRGAEDVEDEGQRHRPARTLIERIRRRRAALHARRARQPGPRHPARPRAHGRLPRLRQQDLERHALRACRRSGEARGAGAIDARRPGGAASAGSSRACRARRRRSTRQLARVPLRRGLRTRLYHFFWDELCDWYIEMVEAGALGRARRATATAGRASREVLLDVLDRSLRLLHPVMPFLTEEIWQRLPGREAVHPETISLAPYPMPRAGAGRTTAAEARMDALKAVVTRVRACAPSCGCRRRHRVTLYLSADDPSERGLLPRARAAAALPAAAAGAASASRRPRARVRTSSPASAWRSSRRASAARRQRAPSALQGELEQARRARSPAPRRGSATTAFLGKAPAQVVEQQRAAPRRDAAARASSCARSCRPRAR